MKFTLSGGGAISGEVQATHGGVAHDMGSPKPEAWGYFAQGFCSLGLLVPESVPSAGSCVARCVRAGMGPGRWLGVLCALLRVLCAMLCDSQAAFSCPLVQGYGRGLASHRVAIAPSDALRQLCLQGSPRPAGAPRRTGQLYIWAASKFLSLAIKRPGSPQGSRARWIPASGPWAHPWPPSRSLCTPSTGSQCVRARLDSPLRKQGSLSALPSLPQLRPELSDSAGKPYLCTDQAPPAFATERRALKLVQDHFGDPCRGRGEVWLKGTTQTSVSMWLDPAQTPDESAKPQVCCID